MLSLLVYLPPKGYKYLISVNPNAFLNSTFTLANSGCHPITKKEIWLEVKTQRALKCWQKELSLFDQLSSYI
jgi:hypothetical protein